MPSRFGSIMQLDIGGWQIRSWRAGDEAALVKYANNRKIWLNLRDAFPYPYTRNDARAWIRFAAAENPEMNFVIASDEEAIGGIGFQLQKDVHRRSAVIGYWLGEPHWGKGIATRAVQALTEYLFANFDLARISAEVFEWNPASARVLEKAGYTCEGRFRKSVTKDGRTIDQLVYAIIRE
jgi:[ribosomal protein S5]-alanine N-acetyltransferase